MACQLSIPHSQLWILVVKIQLIKTRIGENTYFNSQGRNCPVSEGYAATILAAIFFIYKNKCNVSVPCNKWNT